jgi:hypothetical protein
MKQSIFRSRSKDHTPNTNTQPKKIKNQNEYIYSKPEVPLDFSFKKLKSLEQLRKMEPRKGIRRPIEEINRDEIEKSENISLKIERSVNLDEDESEKNDRSMINRGDANINRKFYNSMNFQNNEVEENKITKSITEKKKVKYVTYTNSIILHSNKLSSIENIHNVLNDVLPNLEFSLVKNVFKIDLIQWIDLSHNYIQAIHSDILNLPFLKIFYCHGNLIKDIANVTVLRRCKSLINLSLHGNPIAQIKGYRQYIIEIIPNLEKFDFTLVSEKELDVIHHKSSRFGEKRDKVTGEVIEYPKLDEEIIKRFKSLTELDD